MEHGRLLPCSSCGLFAHRKNSVRSGTPWLSWTPTTRSNRWALPLWLWLFVLLRSPCTPCTRVSLRSNYGQKTDTCIVCGLTLQIFHFLRRCWPFEVSTGGKRKKIIRRVGSGQILLHTLWLAYWRHNLPSHRGFSRVPQCRNKDWLDWTNDNIYLPELNQEAESKRADYLSSRLSETAKELLYARMCGTLQSVPSDDPEIVRIFREAARMPACSVRPRNHGADLSVGDDVE